MNKIQQLDAALAATTDGEWDFVIADNAETPHSMVVDANGEELLTHRYGVTGKAQSDVEFIALARNLAPDLLEAVKLLKVAAHALETPGDFTPEEMQTQVIGDIGAFLAKLEATEKPNTYLLKDGTTTTSTYMEGQYVCKACGSSEVSYQQAVNDASCQQCGMWQNE